MRLIAITGVDGTGKSTLAALLVDELRARGIASRRIYGRIAPIVARLMMITARLTFLRWSSHRSEYPAYAARRSRILQKPIPAGIYSATICAEAIVQLWLKLLPSLHSDSWIVADRYWYDTVIGDLAVHLSFSEEQFERAMHWGLLFIPGPHRAYLLSAPIEVCLGRKQDVPHPDYIAERSRWYGKLGARQGIQLLDAQEPAHMLVQAILDDLGMHESSNLDPPA